MRKRRKILITVAQIASGSVTLIEVSRAEGMMVPLKFPFIQRSVIFVNHLTFKPTVTSLHQQEPTSPEPPRGSPARMHVVNKKQIYTPKRASRPHQKVVLVGTNVHYGQAVG